MCSCCCKCCEKPKHEEIYSSAFPEALYNLKYFGYGFRKLDGSEMLAIWRIEEKKEEKKGGDDT